MIVSCCRSLTASVGKVGKKERAANKVSKNIYILPFEKTKKKKKKEYAITFITI